MLWDRKHLGEIYAHALDMGFHVQAHGKKKSRFELATRKAYAIMISPAE
jgi:hypothetical protein